MQPNEKKVWFPAKRYGWGWGLPCRWQGWVVIVLFLVLAAGGLVVIGPEHVGVGTVYIIALSVGLFVICLFKGEKPRWRWGKE
ncbi:MAG TPA: hypothetical protein VHX86_17765 [Tepidisphaeraceae bacterium]|jgi:hypothetical protein|nr:hypothetical protein [Tepidisphaeraceae bacterium]